MNNTKRIETIETAMTQLTAMMANLVTLVSGQTVPATAPVKVNKKSSIKVNKKAPVKVKPSVPAPVKAVKKVAIPDGGFTATADKNGRIRVPSMAFTDYSTILIGDIEVNEQSGGRGRFTVPSAKLGDIVSVSPKGDGLFSYEINPSEKAPVKAVKKSAVPSIKKVKGKASVKTIIKRTSEKRVPAIKKDDPVAVALSLESLITFVESYVDKAQEGYDLDIRNTNYPENDIRHYFSRADRKAFNSGVCVLSGSNNVGVPFANRPRLDLNVIGQIAYAYLFDGETLDIEFQTIKG